MIFSACLPLQVGEQDIVITAGSWTGLDHLNYTSILSTIGKERDFSHSSPRMVKDISLFDASICRGGLDVTNVTQLYRGPPGGKPCTDPMSAEACLKENCHFPKPASAYFVDMKREAAMGFGKRFELSPGPGGVLIQQELAVPHAITHLNPLFLICPGAKEVGQRGVSWPEGCILARCIIAMPFPTRYVL